MAAHRVDLSDLRAGRSASPDRRRGFARLEAAVHVDELFGLGAAGEHRLCQRRRPDRVAAPVVHPAPTQNGVLGGADEELLRPGQRRAPVGQRRVQH